jgi:hypothetical protein
MDSAAAVNSNTTSSSTSSSSTGTRQGSRGGNKQQLSAGTVRASTSAGSSSSSRSADTDVVAVTSSSNTTSAAAYISSRLLNDARAKMRLNAAGGLAGLNALKMLAKAGQMMEEAADLGEDSGAQLSFQVERRLLRVSSSSSSSGARDEGARGPPALSVNALFVRRMRQGRLSAELQEDDAPMAVRLETEPAKITQHALYCVRRQQRESAAPEGGAGSSRQERTQPQQPVAAFVLVGAQLPARVKVLLRGLSDARRQLYDQGDADLMFTVERSVREMPAEEQQRWRQRVTERQQQQQDEDSAAADDGDAAAAQVDGDSSSSSASDTTPLMKTEYLIKAYLCRPKSKGGQAAQRRSNRDRREAGSSRSSRDGYVEVPAAEWASLREQLEVVPHLTQQLQTMTRQHEQLLSLLAAQQQAGGADVGGSSSGSG